MADALDALYSKKQREVLSAAMTQDWFLLINHGAKRSGKTQLDNDLFLQELRRVRAIADAEGVREPQYILAGADLAAIRRNILIELSNKYGLEFQFDKANRFKLFGVRVCCFGHSKINDLGRIRGMTSWGAYINEATVANQFVFEEILSRCSATGSRIMMDTNPDRPGHWLKTDYIDRAGEPGVKTLEFSWQLTDNTFLDPGYVRNIIASTPSGASYARNIQGQWVDTDDVLFSAPRFYRGNPSDIHGGMAHLDAAFSGSDSSAMTILRPVGGRYIGFGRLWSGHIDKHLAELDALHTMYRAGSMSIETNADKGYVAKDVRNLGIPVNEYHEKENKYVKIATYLRGAWDRIDWITDTDPKYLAQIVAYNERAEHDDAPDSAASLVRAIEKKPTLNTSAYLRGGI